MALKSDYSFQTRKLLRAIFFPVMKAKFILCLILVLLFSFKFDLRAQKSGKVVYTAILESKSFSEMKGVLLFDEDQSFFSITSDSISDSKSSYQDLQLKGNNTMSMEFNIPDNRKVHHQVFIDRLKNQIITQEIYLKNWSFNPCVVIESTGSIRWEITGEEKKIGSFNAFEAITSFRGRNYSAWFTTDIPLSIGPWKFHGLPGLILEIKDEELGVQFLFESIEIPYNTYGLISPPDEGVQMSLEEFAEYKENRVDEIIESLKAKLPRGTEISDISVSLINKEIEREFR